METITLLEMAHGGAAMGRDGSGRAVFVPYAIPGEKVKISSPDDKGWARPVTILKAAPERTAPPCPHFGLCGGCHFQHIDYSAQLRFKQAIVRDQLARVGKLGAVAVRPVLPNPQPYHYRVETTFNKTDGGQLGFWSPVTGRVIPIESCHLLRPELQTLFQDIDLALDGLRKLTLRLGDDQALLLALEVNDVEPPALDADFPVSVVMVLPDKTTANLIGDNYLIQQLKGRDFRVTAGCSFFPSPPAGALVIDTVLNYAALSGREQILEADAGVGLLTAFLAQGAAQLNGLVQNSDAIADATLNLADTDNVSLYQGTLEAILPLLEGKADLMVLSLPAGLSPKASKAIQQQRPGRIIYLSDDLNTLARDGRQLKQMGFRPVEIQPIDMLPQTFHIYTVSLWAL